MKFYSEKLDKFFDTANDCIRAEGDYARANIEKEKLAKEKNAAEAHLTETYKKALDAANEFGKEVDAFIKKYGAVKLETNGEDVGLPLFNLFKMF